MGLGDSAVRYDNFNHSECYSDCYCAGDFFSACADERPVSASTASGIAFETERLAHAISPVTDPDADQDMSILVSRPWSCSSTNLRDLEKEVMATELLKKKILAVLRLISLPLSMQKTKAWTSSMSPSVFGFQWISGIE